MIWVLSSVAIICGAIVLAWAEPARKWVAVWPLALAGAAKLGPIFISGVTQGRDDGTQLAFVCGVVGAAVGAGIASNTIRRRRQEAAGDAEPEEGETREEL